MRRHYDRIFAVCRRITGSEADAADATQNAMISIVRSIDTFDGRSSFGTWCYRIATNASLDELRRRRRRAEVSVDDLDAARRGRPATGSSGAGGDAAHGGARGNVVGPVGEVGSATRGGSDPHPDDVVDRLALDQALALVPTDFRTPLVLRDVGDLDYREIAEILDVPIGTVRSRISRGRAALRAAYLEAIDTDAIDTGSIDPSVLNPGDTPGNQPPPSRRPTE